MSCPAVEYCAVIKGRDEPDTMLIPAGHARKYFKVAVPSSIPDDVILIFTPKGWDIYE